MPAYIRRQETKVMLRISASTVGRRKNFSFSEKVCEFCRCKLPAQANQTVSVSMGKKDIEVCSDCKDSKRLKLAREAAADLIRQEEEQLALKEAKKKRKVVSTS